jgi:hypothetical protein
VNRRFRALFRVAAVVLLLITGAELFACEMIAPDQCESFGFPSDNPSPTNPTNDDNCICCCTHILITEPFTLEACGEAALALEAQTVAPPESEPLSVYRPPKA